MPTLSLLSFTLLYHALVLLVPCYSSTSCVRISTGFPTIIMCCIYFSWPSINWKALSWWPHSQTINSLLQVITTYQNDLDQWWEGPGLKLPIRKLPMCMTEANGKGSRWAKSVSPLCVSLVRTMSEHRSWGSSCGCCRTQQYWGEQGKWSIYVDEFCQLPPMGEYLRWIQHIHVMGSVIFQ